MRILSSSSMTLFGLVIRLTAVLLFCNVLVLAHGDDSHVGDYFAACVTYLEGAKESLQSGGLSQLVSDGYNTYLEYPSGPYVFCFVQNELSEEVVGQSALVLHPFTENKTLNELLDPNDEGGVSLLESKADLISNAVKNGTLGALFNYTEPYSQDKSSAEGGIKVDGEDKMLVGFIDTLGDGVVVQCGCRYTGVPDGERDNSNAIKSEGGAASSTSGGSFSFFFFFSLVFLFILQ